MQKSMKTVLIGAGEVGAHMSELLSQVGHEVTLIEMSAEAGTRADEEQDVKVLIGNGSSAAMLKRAGIEVADNVLSLTSDDRTNLVVCAVSKAMNSKIFTVARVHDQTYLEKGIVNYQKLFQADYLLNPEALAAVELAKVIRNPSRVAVENFARGEIEVQQVVVSDRSRHVGRSLKQIRLKSKVGIVSRGGIVAIPSGDTVLEKGDVLTLYGRPEVLMEDRQNLDPGSRMALCRVVIFGGSEIAISLVRMLNNPRFKVRIIEHDAVLCRDLAERFPEITVIHGDATHRRLMEEEQVGSADHFVAATKVDEVNIMTALQAARLGARAVHLVANKTDYESLLDGMRETMGLASVVSPRRATATEIIKYLTREPMIELCELKGEDAGMALLEVLVREGSRADGRRLESLQEDRPAGCVFVAVVRDFGAFVPGGNDEIRAGDRVVALLRKEDEKRLVKLLT